MKLSNKTKNNSLVMKWSGVKRDLKSDKDMRLKAR